MSWTMIALSILCGLNLLALSAVLLGGRSSRAAGRVPLAPPAVWRDREDDYAAPRAERRAARSTGPSVEDLVAEAEESERLSARGESRLAADLARWRQRSLGGNDRPPAAEVGRLAAGGRSR